MTNKKQNLTKGTTALVVIGLALAGGMLSVPVNAAPITLDLNTFEQKAPLANGDWTVSTAGDSVTQGTQGNPSFFVTPDTYRDLRIRGTVVTPGTDDDFFGWSVAHDKPSGTGNLVNTFMIDWKASEQTHNGYTAPEGLTIYRIDGSVSDSLDDVTACFWGKNDTNCPATVTVLATAHGLDQGWEPGTSYDWSVRIEENLIRLHLTGGTGPFSGGAIAIEATPNVDVFNFGLYTYEQSGVTFSDLWLDDFIAPTVDQTVDCLTPGANDWCLDEVTLSSTGTDRGSGIASLECRTMSTDVDCAGHTVALEGSRQYRTEATDAAGLSTVALTGYKIDTELPEIAPTVTCDGGGNTSACATFLTFSATATDSASGVDVLECDINNVAVPCTGAVELTEGFYDFRVNATDKAGRENTTTISGTIDFSAPTLVATAECNPWGNNGWCPRSATTIGDAFDGLSGIASTQCQLDGVNTTCDETTRSAEGSHVFTLTATDNAGFTNTTSVFWKTDSSKPEGAIVSPAPGCSYLDDVLVECLGETTASGPLTFSGTASDALSGVLRVEFWVDGWKQATFAPNATGYEWTWDTGAESIGYHDVEFRILDVAGNFQKIFMEVLVLPEVPEPPQP